MYSEWISVDERLPKIGEWCNVLYDREQGDYWERKGKPRFSVYGAQLRHIDQEGNATWQRWQLASGQPCDPLYYVTHWMPLPEPPNEDYTDS